MADAVVGATIQVLTLSTEHIDDQIGEATLIWRPPAVVDGNEANGESVFEGLKPHPNLKMFDICGFKGKSLSLCEGLNNLVKINIKDCSECEELPMLGHLPHLKYLCLNGLTNVKSIGTSFYGNIDNCRRDTIVVFPALERLKLKCMASLEEWDEVDLPLPSQIFPRLKYLRVISCTQLMRAPSHFLCLEELEIDGMKNGLALENICGVKLTSLTLLEINGIEGLECLPDWLFSNNHSLTKLQISHCPKMTHLVPRLGGGGAPSLLRELTIWNCRRLRELPDSLISLEKLYIQNCPDMKSIPYTIRNGGQQQQQSFTSLRELTIRDCKGLTNLPIEIVESCTPSLERLVLCGLSNITPPQNLVRVIGCLHKMPRIRYLNTMVDPISCCMGILGSLELKMGPFLYCNNVSFNETFGAMLSQLFISLRRLTLEGKKHWDSLPDQLQHLTSLEIFFLQDFGIEALPEWFGNLSSLKTLCLLDCKKLRHLPSKQAMQRLSKLTVLKIYYCPLLLKEENRSNNNNERLQIVDSEWPKISHIPTVKVYNH